MLGGLPIFHVVDFSCLHQSTIGLAEVEEFIYGIAVRRRRMRCSLHCFFLLQLYHSVAKQLHCLIYLSVG